MRQNDNIDEIIKKLFKSFIDLEDVFEKVESNQIRSGEPIYYGYTMSIGPDGKPQIKEFGNIRPGSAHKPKEPELVDQILNEGEDNLKLILQMKGIAKNEINVSTDGGLVEVSAENKSREYRATVPLKHTVDVSSARGRYANGILELSFRLDDGRKNQADQSIPIN